MEATPHRHGTALASACLALLLAAMAMAGATAPAAQGAIRPAREADAPAQASIVGGMPAEPGRFPWMAFVFDLPSETEAVACSGTVVAPGLVLTAAHCVIDPATGATNDAAGFHVVTGVADWTSPERQVSAVTRVIPFPRYSPEGPSLGFGDAALLVLETPTTAPAVSLATRSQARRLLRTGTRAIVAGWGETGYGQGEPTVSLLWARTRIEGSRCEGLRGRVCAIDFPKATSGVCHGDSGGPLLTAIGRRHRLLIEVGITQAGFGKCSTRRPGVFMRVDLLRRWLETRIAALGAGPSTPSGA